MYINAWEDYKDYKFDCKCGWSGKGYELVHGYETEMITRILCPKCNESIELITNEAGFKEIADIGLNNGTRAYSHMVLVLAETMRKLNIVYPAKYDEAKYDEKYAEALSYASLLHKDQHRKGNRIPYISHLLAVSSIIWENGGDEDMAIAGLLHDAIEDQGGMKIYDEIVAKFGKTIGDMVLDCSDSVVEDSENKLPWRDRKLKHIEHLYTMNLKSLYVVIADKTHNCSMIIHDSSSMYGDVFDRFNAPPEDILWYYQETLKAAKVRLNYEPATVRLGRLVSTLEKIVNAR